MPPFLALLLTGAFVTFLFAWEARRDGGFSRALWLPLIWMLITGSRFASQWLAIWGVLPGGGGGSAGEGSPLDALVFLGLILAGVWVLRKRRLKFRVVFRDNAWLVVFFVYCFLAILWSDYPFVAVKRWIKILGHPVMALIILTEPDPERAIRAVLKRLAFVFLPASILLIKYYPHIGRGFDMWSGAPTNNGAHLNKNELGYVCMITGVFFVWNLLLALKYGRSKERRNEVALSIGFLAMVAWLTHMAKSSTSLACLMIGVAVLLVLGMGAIKLRHLGSYIVGGVLLFLLLDTTFGIYAKGVALLGRDPTLTDRTQVWADAIGIVRDPILGAGFESFWLGERLQKMWEKWWWQPNQAHNGYIEVYLNLGLVGVVILLGWIVSTFLKIKKSLLVSFDYGRFRLAFLFVVLAYNYTEATFKGVSLVWTIFHLISMDYGRRARTASPPTAQNYSGPNYGDAYPNYR